MLRKVARCVSAAWLVAAVWLGGRQPAPGQGPWDPDIETQNPIAKDSALEIQTRGPVHEAFAQPTDPNPEAGPLVPQQPPEPIPEEPPSQRPAEEDVFWISGYWAWDADRNEFIWVSGVYRNAPPGQRYVAGYWQQDGDGWRWVSGFWTDEQQRELNYVPQPPAPLETVPPPAPPEEGYTYTPGFWIYRETRYVWRPGCWVECRPGCVWVPPRYCWTPAGCVFVRGYWDYPLEDRGLLFAPVCFHRPLWRTPGWSYCPSHVVETRALLDALFVGPRHCHYFFGDYYGPSSRQRGFQPWFAYGSSRPDPLYSHYRQRQRDSAAWQNGLRQTYLDRVAGRAPLPPRTFQQQNVSRRQNTSGPLTVVAPLSSSRVRLTSVPEAQLRAQRAEGLRLGEMARTRRQLEKGLAAADSNARTPRTLQLPTAIRADSGRTVQAPPPPVQGKPHIPHPGTAGTGKLQPPPGSTSPGARTTRQLDVPRAAEVQPRPHKHQPPPHVPAASLPVPPAKAVLNKTPAPPVVQPRPSQVQHVRPPQVKHPPQVRSVPPQVIQPRSLPTPAAVNVSKPAPPQVRSVPPPAIQPRSLPTPAAVKVNKPSPPVHVAPRTVRTPPAPVVHRSPPPPPVQQASPPSGGSQHKKKR